MKNITSWRLKVSAINNIIFMWCPNPKCLIIFGSSSQFTCLDGYEISYNGKTSKSQPNSPREGSQTHYIFFTLVCMFPKKAQVILSWNFLSLFGCFSLFSCVSFPKNAKKFPYSLAHFPFYNALLVGFQWWCFIHLVTWTPPLFKIPNQMGPFEDSLETCT